MSDRVIKIMRFQLILLSSFIIFIGCSPEGDSTENKSQPQVQSSTNLTQSDELANETSSTNLIADSIYTNGKIYTVNQEQPWAEAVAIKDGKFIKIGSNEDVKANSGDDTEVVDLGGKFAMPGIHDSHIHPPLPYTLEEAGNLLFPESLSKEEIQQVLREFSIKHPDAKTIRGEKWSTSLFPGGKATKSFIDEIVSDRPVVLVDETGHNMVANTKALELAGITKDTPNPQGGKIDKDAITGEPTGYLSEEGMGLVLKYLPKPSQEAHTRGIKRALVKIRPYGITSFIDMASNEETLKTYLMLEKEGKLNFRIDACIQMNDYTKEFESDPESLLKKRKQYQTRLIDPNHVKYWADGTPFSYTSLLIEPYSSKPDSRGEMTVFKNQIDRFLGFDKEGLTIHLHSVGDGTTRRMLDAFAKVREANPDSKLRHHLAHCMLVDPEDYTRFKKLNVSAEFSPVLWCPSSLSNTADKYVGSERMKRWMPISQLTDAGANTCYGSDWPAGTPDCDPWRGLEAMITRMEPHGKLPGKIGVPVDLATGIRILTINGAMAMQHEDEVGSIEEGKLADFIILDQNLFDLEKNGRVDRISDTHVLKTVFEGKVVYEAMSKDENN